MLQGLASSAFQRLLPEKWCKMPLVVWFSVADYSLLLSAEKPQVPATVRGIKRKLPGTLFVSPWQSISSGEGQTRSSKRVWDTAFSTIVFKVIIWERNEKNSGREVYSQVLAGVQLIIISWRIIFSLSKNPHQVCGNGCYFKHYDSSSCLLGSTTYRQCGTGE